MKRTSRIIIASLFCAVSSLCFAAPDVHRNGGNAVNVVNKWPGNAVAGINFSKPFIENKGQVTDQFHNARTDIQFSFSAAPGLHVFIGNGAIHYQFSKPGLTTPEFEMYRMDVALVGANQNARAIADMQQAYSENYFVQGSDKHGISARSFSRITYKDVYPHIDWVISAGSGRLKHEFVVHKGGKANDIKLKYAGAANLKVNNDGSMTAATPQGAITEAPPVSYNEEGGKVKSAFKLSGDILTYRVGAYHGELTIDPDLAWATYYGGSDGDLTEDVVTDASGNIYMVGNTMSTSSIATTGAFQTVYGGSAYDDFLVKLNSSGTPLWATYYGGDGDDFGGQLALDAVGNIYMVGTSNSLTGIASPGSFQDTYTGAYDGFLAKFNSAGMLKWATYYGGPDDEFVWGVATDPYGYVYISGQTKSETGIATAGSYQDTIGSGGATAEDAFLIKFDSSGNRIWGTYYGGTGADFSNGVATDAAGNVYIGGLTNSIMAIASPGAYQDTFIGIGFDAFVAKFDSGGARQWGTYFGGDNNDDLADIRVDIAGSLYIIGKTASAANIATSGAYMTALTGGYDGYVAKFNTDGTLRWATYYGGDEDDYANTITTDDSGNVVIGGWTSSTFGIATADGYQTAFGGATSDGFLAIFDSSCHLRWGTYYGGSSEDECYSIAVDHSRHIYMVGAALSTSGIATAGAFQSTFAGGAMYGDAFIAKFIPSAPLGVKAAHNGAAVLYPNPAPKALTVTSAVQMTGITITNVTGQVIFSNTYRAADKAEIDVSMFPTGAYSVIINGVNNYREVREFVKQ